MTKKFDRVLSDDDIEELYLRSDMYGGEIYFSSLVEEIEQAVLQSKQVQALRKDAERYRYMKKGGGWIVAATQTGWHVDGGELDGLIDNEMADQE